MICKKAHWILPGLIWKRPCVRILMYNLVSALLPYISDNIQTVAGENSISVHLGV